MVYFVIKSSHWKSAFPHQKVVWSWSHHDWQREVQQLAANKQFSANQIKYDEVNRGHLRMVARIQALIAKVHQTPGFGRILQHIFQTPNPNKIDWNQISVKQMQTLKAIYQLTPKMQWDLVQFRPPIQCSINFDFAIKQIPNNKLLQHHPQIRDFYWQLVVVVVPKIDGYQRLYELQQLFKWHKNEFKALMCSIYTNKVYRSIFVNLKKIPV